jgi:DNA-directed RNA polymerase specialized sigma24 family protein
MHDERYMYRMQWPVLRQHLHRLCLGSHGKVLLDPLCGCTAYDATDRVQAAVDAWCQGILADLAQKAQAPDAWPGWAALLPLFGNTRRLYGDIGQAAEAICQEHADGATSIVWNVLRAYFSDCRDDLDGAKKTRLRVWRRLDRLRQELNRQRRRQGLGDCQHLPELVAYVLAAIQQRGLKDAPTTVEGVLSYFYEFDPAYTQAYDDELHSLEAAEELTGSDWLHDLARGLEQLPAELRQAVEVRYGLSSQSALRTIEEYCTHYGCSARTLRDRADRALQSLRQRLGL